MVDLITDRGASRWSVFVIGLLLFGISSLFLEGILWAKPLYSYRDERGTNVITDNYERIPERYRTKVTTVEQETDLSNLPSAISHGVGGLVKGVDSSLGGATITVPGMSPYQSHAMTVAGSLALLFLVLRKFSRSQAIRFLALWGLVMLGLVMPVLIFFSQDAPLDKLRGQASQIQTKQLDHLKHAQ
jgi:hypothetical protein